ncbi:hypothetical protein J2T06_000579 [Enterobacter ludwigii]|nr:hypothetical protein [Enterobacter ludwigii]
MSKKRQKKFEIAFGNTVSKQCGSKSQPPQRYALKIKRHTLRLRVQPEGHHLNQKPRLSSRSST